MPTEYGEGWNAALDTAIDIAKFERLQDDTEHPEDIAYNFAIDDVVRALEAYRGTHGI